MREAAFSRTASAVLAAVGLLAVLAGGPVRAHTTSGRLTTSFYLYERADTTDEKSTHARAYQVAQLSHVRGSVGIHYFGQFDGDFSTKLVDDPKVRTYGLYLDWKDIASIVDLRVGRQPLFAGVAQGTIDGAKVRVDPLSWLWVEGFGGTLLPPDQDTRIIDDPDKNYLYGGRLVLLPGSSGKVAFSYFEQRQLRPGFETNRADSVGNVFTQLIEPSDHAYQLGSVDASWEVANDTFVLGRADWDFEGRKLSRGEIGGRIRLAAPLSLRSSYVYRTPRVPWNSIFAIFESEETQEVDLTVDWRTGGSLRVYGGGAGVFYDGDESWRGTLGVGTSFLDLNYVHRGGYAGRLDGLNAWLYRSLRKGTLTPNLQVSWARYKVDSRQESAEALFSGALGVNVRPRRSYSLDVELQYLHNPAYEDDVRLLTRFQYWFFHRSREAGS